MADDPTQLIRAVGRRPRLTWWTAMRRAARAAVSSGLTETAGVLITSSAVMPTAFARTPRRCIGWKRVCSRSRYSSLGSQIGLGYHTNEPAFATDDRHSTYTTLVQHPHDLLEARVAPEGDRGCDIASPAMCGTVTGMSWSFTVSRGVWLVHRVQHHGERSHHRRAGDRQSNPMACRDAEQAVRLYSQGLPGGRRR